MRWGKVLVGHPVRFCSDIQADISFLERGPEMAQLIIRRKKETVVGALVPSYFTFNEAMGRLIGDLNGPQSVWSLKDRIDALIERYYMTEDYEVLARKDLGQPGSIELCYLDPSDPLPG